jgi:hypothetical protein
MTQDRIEQAAREILRKQFSHAFPNTDDINNGASSINALIRRERDDAARVERDECAKVCDECYQCGCASAIRARGGA